LYRRYGAWAIRNWLSQVSHAPAADAVLPSRQPHGDNSTRHIARGVALKPGDVIRIEGTPNGLDVAALDYIEVQPAR